MSTSDNKIKIVISGLIFPMTMLHWFWRAFERRDDVDLIVAGPFYNDFIPWEYGIRLPQKYVKKPHIILPPQMGQIKPPASIIQSQLPWRPDLWLQIDSNWHLMDKPKAGIVALVEPDPHVLKAWYEYPKAYSDVVFSMQNNYRKDDEKFLPYAYDPVIYFPENNPKEYDGCLVGLHYPQRDQLVNLLRHMGFKINYQMSIIYDENRIEYNKSKIALSWSTLLDTPARVWEGMGLGMPLLCNRTPDLDLFFEEGKHYLGFSSLEEAGRQFTKLIADPEMAAQMGRNAQWEVSRMGTWDIRVDELLKEVGLV